MVFCSRCNKKIPEDRLSKTYQIYIGNMINNLFYANETYYYHIDCLNVNSENQSENYLSVIKKKLMVIKEYLTIKFISKDSLDDFL